MRGRIWLLLAVLFAALTFIVSCNGGGGSSSGDSTNTPTYTVTYNDNGSTGGSVPVDSTNYTQGQTVTVLANTGNLIRTNYSFSSWNTLADGSGTTYTQGQTVTMGSANITLYAKWTAVYSISGTVKSSGSSTALQGVTMTLTGASTATATATSDASGNYTFAGIANGTYTITPSLNGYTFTATNKLVTISGANSTTNNFTSLPTTGLIAYYPFSGNANDTSGSGNNGTVNGATLSIDRFGNNNYAYSFNGTNSYINCGNSATFNLNNHTIAAWINIDATVDTAGSYIVGKVNPNAYETLSFGISGSNNTIGTAFATGSEINHSLSSTTALLPNHWYFVAMTYDNSTVKFYIDGVLDTSFSRTGTVRTSTNNLAIGRHNGDASLSVGQSLFKGSIDDVCIYNRALSSGEIQALYTDTATQ